MPTWNTPEARDRVIRTLIGEAAAGDQQSLISVAHVIKNRADSGQYGDKNASGTVMAPKQFSMWNSNIASSGKTISPSDPRYQQAGQIADAVFGGQIPDNTGGADHYYAPSGMPGGRAPSWAIGKTPTATIGGQHFYKFGLSAEDATNMGHTSAPAVNTIPAAPTASAGQFGPNNVYANIPAKGASGEDQLPMFLRWNPDPVGNDQKNFAGLNPTMQRVIAQARTDNPNLSFVIGNGRRSAQDQDWAKSVGWSKVGSQDGGDALIHMQGNAVDLWGLDKNGHVQFDPAQQQQISQAMKAASIKLGVPMDWGGDWKSFKDAPHFELKGGGTAEVAGAEGPKYVAPVIPASSDAAGPASSAAPAAAASAPIPTSASQPASATAPGSSGGNFAVPPAGAAPPAGAYPGSDKYSVIQGMTTGTSHNPQLTTAANWGNLFGGGGAPAPPPAPPAAAAPSPQPASAPLPPVRPADAAPIDRNNPLPWQGPQQGPPVLGTMSASPVSSTLPAPGTNVPYSDDNETPAQMPGGGGRRPAWTPGQPSMGFPAQQNPFGQPPPDQNASLPGSMFASAQNLLKLLFPTA